MTSILEEIESALWDNRSWDMAMKTDKPVENYEENRRSMDEAPATPIDDLPNKDWLRAT